MSVFIFENTNSKSKKISKAGLNSLLSHYVFSHKRSSILLFENDLKIVTDGCALFPTAKPPV